MNDDDEDSGEELILDNSSFVFEKHKGNKIHSIPIDIYRKMMV